MGHYILGREIRSTLRQVFFVSLFRISVTLRLQIGPADCNYDSVKGLPSLCLIYIDTDRAFVPLHMGHEHRAVEVFGG